MQMQGTDRPNSLFSYAAKRKALRTPGRPSDDASVIRHTRKLRTSLRLTHSHACDCLPLTSHCHL